MTNKEWLSSLPAEEFYDMFKEAEERGKCDIDTRLYMINWLNQEHTYYVRSTEDRCVMCGDIIPEGRQICPNCESGWNKECVR